MSGQDAATLNNLYEVVPSGCGKASTLREGEPVSVTPKAFDTLIVLVQHAGQVLDKNQRRVCWPDSAVEEANLRLNIPPGATLNERGYITTVPGGATGLR